MNMWELDTIGFIHLTVYALLGILVLASRQVVDEMILLIFFTR